MNNELRCGYVAILGRPNVGKSTLLNRLLGQKLSITSRKPQTTRHRLLGIKTQADHQIIYVDTPGIQQQQGHALNRYLNRVAHSTLHDVDVVIWLVEALRWHNSDELVLKALKTVRLPVILVVNKVDKIKDKTQLLPYVDTLARRYEFSAIIPLSARKDSQFTALEAQVLTVLPQVSSLFFPEEQLTDSSERFLVSELIREKLFQRLGDELPYRLTVAIEHFQIQKNCIHISAIIWVDRPGHKAIVIGHQGQMLKAVGEAARKDIEQLLAQRVFLQLWVKVRQGWYDDEQALQQLGYRDA
ncbi:MAG: GTPase Era [Pseudomonadota bacterium]|nr:GTPase Era [Pseudomonadota bacterium]